jgi:hypothetical protein
VHCALSVYSKDILSKLIVRDDDFLCDHVNGPQMFGSLDGSKQLKEVEKEIADGKYVTKGF